MDWGTIYLLGTLRYGNIVGGHNYCKQQLCLGGILNEGNKVGGINSRGNILKGGLL